MRSIVISAIAISLIGFTPQIARAAQTYTLQQYPEGLVNVPCSAFKRTPNGSWKEVAVFIFHGSKKHAVEGITKSVALETAKSGIRVNGVAPGPTDTGMLTRFTGTPENKAALVTGVPMGRLGLSEELANAIVFIASDEASFITGHILNVDGGHTAN